MLSSERKDRAEVEAMIVHDILKKLPDEINAGLLAAIIISVLCGYAMEEEWEKIVDTVNETMDDISSVFIFTPPEVLVN